MSNIINEVKQILEQHTYIDKHDGEMIGYEVYCDYNDKLSETTLAQITKSDNPREKFDEIMSECLINAEDYYYPELFKTIKDHLKENEFEDNEDQIREWIDDHVYYYMPEEHFNTNVPVSIALDTGDADTDFTQCNILNWYGNHGYRDANMPLNSISPIRWLATQQDKLKEVEKMIDLELDEYVVKYDQYKFSEFSQSIIEELENLPSHMACLTFLVSMPLFDYFKLTEQKEGKIILTKSTPCGLYDPWNGGGSILEIRLNKDVELPIDKIWHSWIDYPSTKAGGFGYSISDVYGLLPDSWSGEIKFDDPHAETENKESA